jgi:hypothetical protein
MTEFEFFNIIDKMPNGIDYRPNGILVKSISLYRGCINNEIDANYHICNYAEDKQLNIYLNKIDGTISISLWNGKQNPWKQLKGVERCNSINEQFLYQLIEKYL